MRDNVIKRAEKILNVAHVREYINLNGDGGGYSFDCDKAGSVEVRRLQPAGLKNYQACLEGTNGTKFVGIRKIEWSGWDCAIVKCSCGEVLHIGGPYGETDCECGLVIASNGEIFRPRSEWEADDNGYDVDWF
ncbi:MAG: hypothetical protein HQM11_07835 [SAR324 cluster bacterium]|nr:hypothetical protein [SAR324 cluster bacterium]